MLFLTDPCTNSNILKEYLNSIPNTYKIDDIDINDLYLPNIRSK